jgi:hypothetical protein
MRKVAMQRQYGILWNKSTCKEIKKTIFHSIAEIILLYGGEMWPMVGKSRGKVRTISFD